MSRNYSPICNLVFWPPNRREKDDLPAPQPHCLPNVGSFFDDIVVSRTLSSSWPDPAQPTTSALAAAHRVDFSTLGAVYAGGTRMTTQTHFVTAHDE